MTLYRARRSWFRRHRCPRQRTWREEQCLLTALAALAKISTTAALRRNSQVYLRTFTCLSAMYRSSVLCGIRSTRFCRRCMPPDVPMSTTPGREPNCFKMVSSLTDKNVATSETVSIRGSALSAALIPPPLTGACRVMETISAASCPTTRSVSS
jgi:hypothetical protein